MHRKVPVRFGPGAARKRACTTGTSPAAYRCYYLLESAGLNVQLVNSRHARQLAGRPKPTRRTRSGSPGWPRWACCGRRSCRRRRSGRCGT